MRRVDLYIHEKQFNFLVAQQGTLSEVIRRAIDDYIEKIRAIKGSGSQSEVIRRAIDDYIEKIRAIKVSGSQSQRKEGDTNE